MVTTEIYLTNNNISSSEWNNLINKISNINGNLNRWKLLIKIENNTIRYFINSKNNLPTTLNGLDNFIFKTYKNICINNIKCTRLLYLDSNYNLIDFINYFNIRDKKLIGVEISFYRFFNNIYSYVYLYVKDKYIKKYLLIISIPNMILSINFNCNKNYFYKKITKYLDINKVMFLLNNYKSNSILNVDTFPYMQGDFYLSLNDYSFDKHSIILGSSGCGKSKFISSLIANVYKNESLRHKYKFIVIDPHASLENDIGGYGNVIDFKNSLSSISLFNNKSSDVISSSELLCDLFKGLISNYNSKLDRVLKHAIYLLLSLESFNFTNLRKLLVDMDYRNKAIKSSKDIPYSITEFFLTDFNELKTKSYNEAISPIIGFIDEMEMVPVFNEESNYNLEDIISNNFLNIFSLDRTKLGDKIVKTISGLIMQQLFTLSQKRVIEEKIIFIVDEVSIIENDILCRFLAESRKYNLSLFLAGQYFSQLSDNLTKSIFSNVVNYYLFRVSRGDALSLVDNINMKVQIDDNKESKVKILTELNNRECIVRINKDGILLPAFKGKSIDFISVPRIYKEETFNSKDISINSDINKTNNNFKISSNVNLKDILISNSTSRKVVDLDE